MKKSRIAKFALLGASTAALAATLSTSTYAWYVTNQKADISAVNGNTASADSAGAISLSATGIKGSFKKSLALNAFGENAKLLPVTTLDGKTFYSLDENTDADTGTNGKQVACTTAAGVAETGYKTVAAGSVLKYSFFILAEGETTGSNTTTTVQPTITITNKTATNDFKAQINYSNTALTPSDIAAGETFYANALNAMSMSSCMLQGSTLVTNLTNAAAVTTAFGATPATTLNSIDALSAAQSVSSSVRYATSTTNAFPSGAYVASAGAQSYYNAISGNILYDKTGSPKATERKTGDALGNITIDNMKPMLLEFYLWLDGAADACFNACEQQTFDVAFSFQVVTA